MTHTFLINSKTGRKAIDVTGRTFGKWTVIRFDPTTTKFVCQCACGARRLHKAVILLLGVTQSCSKCRRGASSAGELHQNAIDLTGQRFGRWTVIEFASTTKAGPLKWKCKCDCGTERNVISNSLRAGTSRGCKSCFGSTKEKPPMDKYYSIVKESAPRRNLTFTITKAYISDLFEAQGGKCALSGLPIHLASSYKNFRDGGCTASLDRIDSLRGYEKGNVQWVHKYVNLMKVNLLQSSFLGLCALVAAHSDANPISAEELEGHLREHKKKRAR